MVVVKKSVKIFARVAAHWSNGGWTRRRGGYAAALRKNRWKIHRWDCLASPSSGSQRLAHRPVLQHGTEEGLYDLYDGGCANSSSRRQGPPRRVGRVLEAPLPGSLGAPRSSSTKFPGPAVWFLFLASTTGAATTCSWSMTTRAASSFPYRRCLHQSQKTFLIIRH